MIRSIQKCDEGFDMHNDLTFTLELVEELGLLKLADVLAEAVDIGTQAPVRGGQRGGSRVVEVVKLVAAVRPSWVPSTRKGMCRV